ncbi:MAG: hypothetical protein P1P90_03960 [Patescibacteria group bacterium]|nr:hypothetical protein [Patescibacteria group bacterium]
MKPLKIIGIIIGVILLAVIGYGIFSYIQLTQGDLKDLGVRYTEEDAKIAIEEKAGVDVNDLSKVYFGSNFATEGSVPVDTTFTDSEISAIQNYANESSGPFKQVQIHFIGDGMVEASGYVEDPRVTIPGPVYVKGEVVRTGPKSFTTNIESLQVGDYVVPRTIIEKANSEFLGYVNGILGNIDGLNVESIQINNGSVDFKGDLPERVYGLE